MIMMVVTVKVELTAVQMVELTAALMAVAIVQMVI